jgi:hypothetical protein
MKFYGQKILPIVLYSNQVVKLFLPFIYNYLLVTNQYALGMKHFDKRYSKKKEEKYFQPHICLYF